MFRLVGFGFFIDSLSRRYCMSLVNRVLYSVGFVSGFLSESSERWLCVGFGGLVFQVLGFYGFV